ncbi:juvenile hormone acid O-methyltransferase-like [Musca autumnalis]|uniref:juvenile hormone acid O-methyltransferase-like n=1 Tax=Musca autumnalis TaxID=221902 RepID=UPI003CFA1404
MNKPQLYQTSNGPLKEDSEQQITKIAKRLLQFRPEGGDTFIDIGCGPGDVSINYIYPLMPENFGKLVFTDVSLEMLDFFKNTYQIPNKCELKLLDIATKTQLPSDLVGQFDHVISALLLHWVPDNRTALRNMFKLLRPSGGDCILTFFSYHNVFETNKIMSSNPKWSQYMTVDVDRFVAPLQYSPNPKEEFKQMMEETGFSNISIDIKHGIYRYDNLEVFKESIIPVCGIFDCIPKSRHLEFIDDYCKVMTETAAKKRGISLQEALLTMAADMIVVYAQKLPSQAIAYNEINNN